MYPKGAEGGEPGGCAAPALVQPDGCVSLCLRTHVLDPCLSPHVRACPRYDVPTRARPPLPVEEGGRAARTPLRFRSTNLAPPSLRSSGVPSLRSARLSPHAPLRAPPLPPVGPGLVTAPARWVRVRGGLGARGRVVLAAAGGNACRMSRTHGRGSRPLAPQPPFLPLFAWLLPSVAAKIAATFALAIRRAFPAAFARRGSRAWRFGPRSSLRSQRGLVPRCRLIIRLSSKGVCQGRFRVTTRKDFRQRAPELFTSPNTGRRPLLPIEPVREPRDEDRVAWPSAVLEGHPRLDTRGRPRCVSLGV